MGVLASTNLPAALRLPLCTAPGTACGGQGGPVRKALDPHRMGEKTESGRGSEAAKLGEAGASLPAPPE